MADGFKISLKGDKELLKRIEDAPLKMQRALFRGPLKTAAKILLERIKAEVPKGAGDLARSLKVRAIKRSRVRVGYIVRTGKEDAVFSGATFYGAFVELGHKIGKRLSKATIKEFGDKRGKVQPNAFMLRGLIGARGLVKAVFRNELNRVIAESVSKTNVG